MMPNGSPTVSPEDLLTHAASYPDFPDWDDLNQATLAELTVSRGIDFATAVYFDRLTKSKQHASFIEQVDHQPSSPCPLGWSDAHVLAVVPGSFYRQFPHVGADGALVREVAESLGLRTVLVETNSQGMAKSNGRTLAQWIAAQPATSGIILTSVCSGAASVLDALERLRGTADISKLVSWLNICGLVQGTPLSDWVHTTRFRKWTYQLLMGVQRLNFGVVSDMRWRPGAATKAWRPPELPTIHVQGVPLSDGMTNRLTTSCRRRIAPWGPNDGILLLSDTMQLPGFIYPVWGADHYMRPSWQMKKVVARLLCYVHAMCVREVMATEE